MSHARNPPLGLGGGSESITLEEDDSLDAELDDLAALGAYARAAKVARATNGGSPTTPRGVLPGASSFRKRGAEKVVVASAGPGGDPAMLNVRGLGGGGRRRGVYQGFGGGCSGKGRAPAAVARRRRGEQTAADARRPIHSRGYDEHSRE